LAKHVVCCDAARRTCRSLHLQKQERGKFTVSGFVDPLGYQGCSLMGRSKFFHLPSVGPEVTDPAVLQDIIDALQKTFELLTLA
jgi:hypothetical protein